MSLFDVYCPLCGKLNRHLLLEETEGQMECCRCKRVLCVCDPMTLRAPQMPDYITNSRLRAG